MKVAAIQMVSGTDLPHNLQQAHQLLQQAAHAGAELAVLPEYFAFMGQRDTDKLALQEAPGHGPVQDFLARTARELQLWLVGGTLPLASAEPRRASNSALAYNPAGECVARYDKIHLFCYDNGRERYDEAQTLVPGQQPTAFGLTDRSDQAWRIGLSVCYDLRFAELYRQLQADVLLVPAAFTHTTGQAHWDVLLRARAIENQAYVLASAQGGLHDNGRRTWGHSLVADPWGQVLARHASGPGLALAELDMAYLQQVRAQLPALQHRRL
ncbi:carbon-nitrogen hydrolase family protein [Macromonas bipunctata]|uniref:carbon-nitrogen hydrolase family protein n=1 Tax=Macromonas bipunctata TaxID=183670 RepID=UPI000C33DF7E|nr:carbon-nitrogen hydrolase family protein [Macromonas bipunctata]